MAEVIKNLGITIQICSRKIRSTYHYKNAEIAIDIYKDELSFIPPLLEIECDDENVIFEIVEKLGFKKEDCSMLGGTMNLIKLYNKR
jgi:adenylate cyclase class IV